MPRILPLAGLLAATLLLLAAPAPARAQAQLAETTTLVIAPVPPSEAHAEALVGALGYANIAVVYSTGGARADRVAERVARRLGAELRPYDLDPLHKDEFAGWLLANVLPAAGGQAVALIAPADVIPHLMKRAIAADADEFPRVARDDLLTLTLAPSYVSLVRGKLALPGSDR